MKIFNMTGITNLVNKIGCFGKFANKQTIVPLPVQNISIEQLEMMVRASTFEYLRKKEKSKHESTHGLMEETLQHSTPKIASRQVRSPKLASNIDFYEASEIYFKHIEANEPGTVASQPNKRLSKFKKGIWYLRNTNGLIARVGVEKKKVFRPGGAA